MGLWSTFRGWPRASRPLSRRDRRRRPKDGDGDNVAEGAVAVAVAAVCVAPFLLTLAGDRGRSTLNASPVSASSRATDSVRCSPIEPPTHM